MGNSIVESAYYDPQALEKSLPGIPLLSTFP